MEERRLSVSRSSFPEPRSQRRESPIASDSVSRDGNGSRRASAMPRQANFGDRTTFGVGRPPIRPAVRTADAPSLVSRCRCIAIDLRSGSAQVRRPAARRRPAHDRYTPTGRETSVEGVRDRPCAIETVYVKCAGVLAYSYPPERSTPTTFLAQSHATPSPEPHGARPRRKQTRLRTESAHGLNEGDGAAPFSLRQPVARAAGERHSDAPRRPLPQRGGFRTFSAAGRRRRPRDSGAGRLRLTA